MRVGVWRAILLHFFVYIGTGEGKEELIPYSPLSLSYNDTFVDNLHNETKFLNENYPNYGNYCPLERVGRISFNSESIIREKYYQFFERIDKDKKKIDDFLISFYTVYLFYDRLDLNSCDKVTLHNIIKNIENLQQEYPALVSDGQKNDRPEHNIKKINHFQNLSIQSYRFINRISQVLKDIEPFSERVQSIAQEINWERTKEIEKLRIPTMDKNILPFAKM